MPHDKSAPSPIKLRRDIGLVGLTFVSLGSIIGSGWLLGALTAATIAGPAAIISWILAAVIIAVLALIHAELGAAYPVSGGTARFSYFAFGSVGGFAAGWLAWLGTVAAAPIEVMASLQYLSNKVPGLVTVAGGTPVLTAEGLTLAVILMLLFTIVNLAGVRWFTRVNSAIVWVKVAVPVLTVIVLAMVSFHPTNFHAGGGFAPYGFTGILNAMPAGVVYGLLGFEYAIQVGGEARNPSRNMPRAVIGSMMAGTVIYLLLQTVFIGALDPARLVHGWSNPIETGALGPYAGLATSLGLGWLAFALYLDAFLSPSGSALVNVSASSRLGFGLSKNGFFPPMFQRLNGRSVPVVSIAFSFIIGLLLFLPFPSWRQMVGFITSAFVLMYAFAPITLAALRKSDPSRVQPYRLPCARFFAPAGFTGANLIAYWSGWQTDGRLFIAILAGAALLAFSRLTGARDQVSLDWHSSMWIAPWMVGLAAISYLGRFGGGLGVIPMWWDIAIVVVFSVTIFYFACSVALPRARVEAYIEADKTETADESLPHRSGAR